MSPGAQNMKMGLDADVGVVSNTIYTFLIPVLRRTKRRSIADQGRTTETGLTSKPTLIWTRKLFLVFLYKMGGCKQLF
jgi:hypothetical protein